MGCVSIFRHEEPRLSTKQEVQLVRETGSGRMPWKYRGGWKCSLRMMKVLMIIGGATVGLGKVNVEDKGCTIIMNTSY